MKLFAFRHSDGIPLSGLADVCRRVGAILGITPTLVEQAVGDIEPNQLFAVSTAPPSSNEPVVAIVFTTRPPDESVLGEGVERSRGAWVRFNPDTDRTVQAVLHELGHICEAGHCTKKSCLMFQYQVERHMNGAGLSDLFCDSCLRAIMESWVYRRLRAGQQTSERPPIPEAPRTAAQASLGPQEHREAVPRRAFPDWSLPRTEFIRQVKQFFDFE